MAADDATPQAVLPPTTHALLDAIGAIASDLDLHGVLTRIVEAACRLTDARYGALGVLGEREVLVDFVTTGISDAERAAIGDPPHGRGILGLLIHHPEPIRLDDLSRHPAAVGFPPNHPPMGTFLGVPVRIRGTVFGNLYLTEKAGALSFTEQDQLLVESLSDIAGFVIDNARAYGLSERRRQWLEAAADLDETLQPPISFVPALREIARTARPVAGALAVAVGLGRDDADAAVSTDAAEVERIHAEFAEICSDLSLPRSEGPVELSVGDHDALVVPLRTHLASRGGLLAAFFPRGTRPLPVESRELLASYADHAALALDRAQGLDDRAALAVTSDRERIARDLHDVVIQRLFATGLQLQRAGVVTDDDTVTEILDGAVDALDTTIRDIRGTIFELQQHDTADSLRSQVRALVQEYAPLLKFDPDLRTVGPVDTVVPSQIRDQLLPVLREALSNVARHSGSTSCEIEVALDNGGVRLSVRDDGVGMGQATRESGLANARRRAADLGGRLEVTPRNPHGTSFVWWVPLPRS